MLPEHMECGFMGTYEELFKKMKRIWLPQIIACGMLLYALNPSNPYGYYILLRWVCCGIFAYLAFQMLDKKALGWALALGSLAVVHNPILRFHLTREIWSVVNVFTIFIALASIGVTTKRVK